uniref:cytochrome b6-f complex iron-sulfur subunit-like isoform X2 n=1 Tax=Erigeron canadensis TaxID=72917 RepID=UPI001CB98B4E|nr:cytochrome b6-f complex iron-sulfur subunit-like isoform X2 [Erigeron canadensis]
MAAAAARYYLATTSSSQYCCSKNHEMLSPTRLGKMPMSVRSVRKEMKAAVAGRFPTEPVTDRRSLMNLLLFGAVGLPAATMLLPFFTPQPCLGISEGSTKAKDEFGEDITASEWLKTNRPGDRTLTQGLKGDPTYLIVENNGTLVTFGINAVCTHLGCIVPWNTVEKKFMCPCHGSRYNNEGKVISGPATQSLGLAHVNIDDGKVVFAPWTETDFRTGDSPWWS